MYFYLKAEVLVKGGKESDNFDKFFLKVILKLRKSKHIVGYEAQCDFSILFVHMSYFFLYSTSFSMCIIKR